MNLLTGMYSIGNKTVRCIPGPFPLLAGRAKTVILYMKRGYDAKERVRVRGGFQSQDRGLINITTAGKRSSTNP